MARKKRIKSQQALTARRRTRRVCADHQNQTRITMLPHCTPESDRSKPTPVMGARAFIRPGLAPILIASLLLLAATASGQRSQAAGDNESQLINRLPAALKNRYDQQQQQQQQPRGQVVFPIGSTSAPTKQANARSGYSQANSMVFVNPLPTTSSGGRSRFVVVDAAGSAGSNKAPLRPSGAAQRAKWASEHAANSLGSAPSSIGKSERQQVAEWPFFKSLQSHRSGQLNQQPASVYDLMRSPTTASGSSATTTTSTTTTTLPTATTTSTGGELEATTTVASITSGSSTTQMPTTTQAGQTSSQSAPADEDQDEDEGASSSGGQNEPSQATTASPSTTSTESTSTNRASSAVMLERHQLDQTTPVFSPDYHKSIQSALDRLVEMSGGTGAATAAAKTKAEVAASAAPQVVRVNGQRMNAGGASSSSLSLNVLLKNFGAFNLSSLDQILLKSNLNNNNSLNRNKTLNLPAAGRGDQLIEIRGVHSNSPPPADALGELDKQAPGGTNGTQEADGDAAALVHSANTTAECKIQYTADQVNISLINDDKNDYTCDYIIDRKLGGGASEGQRAAEAAGRRICQLHLKSAFFANESTVAPEGESICAGATYLSMGELHFCYSAQQEPAGRGLDRVFSFPTDKRAFDIRLVHKSGEWQAANKRRPPEVASDEIHLEIKPLVDANCGPHPSEQSVPTPHGADDGSDSADEEQARRTGEWPAGVGGRQHGELAASQRVAIQNGTPRRKFVLKMAQAEKQLQPLNRMASERRQSGAQRAATSQTFEVEPEVGGGRETGAEMNSIGDELAPDGRRHEMAAPLCSELAREQSNALAHHFSVHVSTIGQLTTPNYPDNYTTGTRCKQVIRRVSRAYCQLLLHFRDFDLTNNETAGRAANQSEPCQEDYLQIGETRYCNRYAMIGHKMLLNYSAPQHSDAPLDESIELLFHSDQRHTGRGFLIKYQQLLCPGLESAPPPARSGAPAAGRAEQTLAPARLQTLAPALQQPDFSLGGRGRGRPAVLGDNSSNAEVRDTKRRAASSSGAALLQAASSTPTSSSARPPSSISKRQSSDEQLAQCNQANSEMSFLVASQNYPQNYANNAECLYYVRRNSSRVCYLELAFVQFDLEPDSDCRYDYFEINNVRLCGSLATDTAGHRTTRIYLFEEPVKVMRFKSDAVGTRAGFLISVEQLECARDGSIVRRGQAGGQNPEAEAWRQQSERRPYDQRQPSNRTVQQASSSMFEYDSTLLLSAPPAAPRANESRPAPRARQLEPRGQRQSFVLGGAEAETQAPLRLLLATARPAPSGCDDFFYGRELTIRSPNWPESYTSDEWVSSCKYTIVRANQPLALAAGDTASRPGAGKMICQLELRFVHLRLSFSDCLDIGGLEMLCGFNTRNLVKYYPLAERQTHLTITFTTNAAKFARTFRQLDGTGQNHSDLLPGSRQPRRFMIIVRQLECVDDFLAPQVELEPVGRADATTVAASRPPASAAINATNLLYSPGDKLLTPMRPRYANRTLAPDGRRPAEPQATIAYDGPSSRSNASSSSRDGLLMYSFSSSLGADIARPASEPRRQQQAGGACLLQLSQYNGLLSAAAILDRLELARPAVWSDELYHQRANECEIRLKLLPGYCALQLQFADFDLYPARANSFCLGEYLELAGVQYCGHELRNTTRLLATSLAGQRHITLRSMLTGASSFRALFRQLECETRPLELGQPQADEQNQPKHQQQQPQNRSSPLAAANAVELREIHIGDEFFEVDSRKLTKRSVWTYEPNMFVVFKLHRSRPEVCKVRLMFYKFQLEPATLAPGGPACQRDFLDINGLDRLCGSLEARSSHASREYHWPQAEQHFKLSFVSDASDQRAGFHIFGQQLSATCGADSAAGQQQQQQAEEAKKQAGPVPTEASKPAELIATPHQDEGQAAHKVAPLGQLPANCSLVVEDLNFELASPNWPRPYNSTGACHYLLRRAPTAGSEAICSVTLRVNSLILDVGQTEPASSCDAQESGATDHLELDGETRLCGVLSRPRTFTFHFNERQFIIVKFVSKHARGFGFHIEGQQNRCAQPAPEAHTSTSSGGGSDQQEPAKQKPSDEAEEQKEGPEVGGQQRIAAADCNRLLVGQSELLESVNFPNAYENNQDCLIAIRRPNESVCAIDLTFNYFQLEEASQTSGVCENDYLELDYSRLCGAYPSGHKLRFHYYTNELDKLLRFRSDASNRHAGFSITVGQVQGAECRESSGATEPPANRKETQQPQQHELINYLPDSAASSAVELPNGPGQQRNEPNGTAQPAGGQRALTPSATLCQFVYHSERQLLVSPGYAAQRQHYDNNLDCLYKIVAASYDICALRLTLLDLELEGSRDCLNDYLLIDNRRYCGQLAALDEAGGQAAKRRHVIELEFSAELPREIHLLFHTDSQANSGRGFKLLSEQVACQPQQTSTMAAQSAEQEFKVSQGAGLDADSVARARQLRRLRFGQLNYPKNYVSSSTFASQQRQQPAARRAPQADAHEPAAGGQELDLMLSKEIVVKRTQQRQ